MFVLTNGTLTWSSSSTTLTGRAVSSESKRTGPKGLKPDSSEVSFFEVLKRLRRRSASADSDTGGDVLEVHKTDHVRSGSWMWATSLWSFGTSGLIGRMKWWRGMRLVEGKKQKETSSRSDDAEGGVDRGFADIGCPLERGWGQGGGWGSW